MVLPDIDLKPYGINLELKSTLVTLNPYLTEARIAKATASGDKFMIGGSTYVRGEKLGAGSYGETYKCQGPNNKEYAVKIIKDGLITVLDFQNFLKEIIIQIILASVSKDEPYGPYVPRIYSVGYDAETHRGYIVSDLLRSTLNSLISKLTAEENDIVIPAMLDQVAQIFEFFGKTVQFNHRDCKDDNIMYVRDGNRRIYKLIDFGFSCLKWNNLQISGGNVFKASSTCFRRERDLGQLLYNIRRYTPQLSPGLKDWLGKALMAEVGKEKCSITEGCEIHGRKVIEGWRNTYNFFNRPNVQPLYANPTALLRKLHYLKDKQPFNSPKPVKEPRRSITRNSKKTSTGVCPPGKIRNPATRRCVNITGSKGTKIAKASGLPAAAVQLLPVVEKQCSPGKIVNPHTGRCIKADGALGKLLQKAF